MCYAADLKESYTLESGCWDNTKAMIFVCCQLMLLAMQQASLKYFSCNQDQASMELIVCKALDAVASL